MKQLFLINIILLISSSLFSQIISSEPEFPTISDELTITFNAAEGNKQLMGYSGDIYAHTGVITSSSSNGSDWKHVKTEWGENTSETKLTKVGTDLYELKITPDIIDYYGVTDGETVKKLAFVFRNEDGSKTGKTETGGDIFLDIYEDGLSLSINQPNQNPYFIDINTEINIEASTSIQADLKIYIDNELKQETTGTSISYTHTVTKKGDHEIKITASDGTEEVIEYAYYFVREDNIQANLPDNVRDGINIIDDNTVTLVLFAPNKNNVFVIGDFNNWIPKSDYLMNKTPDGNRFWLTITGLEVGKEYIFQYLIDETIRIADPYSNKISDPWNDKYIPETIYPNLIDYPEGKTTEPATVISTTKDTYNWQNTTYTLPENEDLIIYELLVRDYTENGDIKTVQDTLDYLQNLGVNAIELMPFSEFEGNDSWGYNPSFYFATDKAYGTPTDYKNFIDECHKRGMVVIMDMVLNHSYGQSPLVRMYFDPSAGDYGQPTAENPWYNQTSPNTSYSWGFDFNHESEHTQAFVDSVVGYWLREYKVDGFRFDFTKGFTNQSGDGGAYDASRIAILKRMADKIWNVNPDAYVILEHFADNNEEKELSDYGMMIWGNLNHSYAQNAKGYSNNIDLSWGLYNYRSWTKPNLVTYMESHDEERLMYEVKENGNYNASYNTQNEPTASERMQLTALFFLTLPGPKMIWQFGELGYDYSIDYNGRVGRKPIKWEYYDDVNRRKIYDTYAYLIKLRKEYEVFNTTDFVVKLSTLTKSIKLNGNNENVYIVGNFDITYDIFNADFQHTGTWFECFSGETYDVDNTNMELTLNPGEFKMYIDKTVDVFTGISEIKSKNQSVDIYPIPSSSDVYIQTNDADINSEILIYNVSGQVVNKIPAIRNSHTKWNGNNFSGKRCNAGTYFIRYQSKNNIYTGKILLN